MGLLSQLSQLGAIGHLSVAKIGQMSYMRVMEQFLDEVRQFAEQRGIKPATVIYNADNRNSMTWDNWVDGTASPTMKTVEKIRKYMANSPLERARAAE